MKRLIVLIISFFVSTLWPMDAVWVDDENHVTLSPVTNAIHRRYYFVQRLKESHGLLSALQNACDFEAEQFEAFTQLQLEHPSTLECVATMQEQQSVTPLIKLWQEIAAYKYLSDEQLIKEYTTLLCLVAQYVVEQVKNVPVETQKALLNVLTRSVDRQISSHEVAFRYYLIKRLKRAHRLIALCQNIACQDAVFYHMPEWSHDRIGKCVENMKATGSLQSVLQVLNEAERFCASSDMSFVQELLKLVVIVEQHALAPAFLPPQRELFAHYEHDIDGLSIEELLKSIDILTAHIEPYTAEPEIEVTSYVPVSTVMALGLGLIATWYLYA